jgi:hypothetical protein
MKFFKNLIEIYKNYSDYEYAKNAGIETIKIPKIKENNKNIKIALCLSGYYNSRKDKETKGDDGFDYIKRKILNGNDVDVYIHSWDKENESNIIENYKIWIKEIKVEDQKDFSKIFHQNKLEEVKVWGNTLINKFSHFYSVQESIKLMVESNKKYDCVILTRFDLSRTNRLSSGPNFSNKYPVQCIDFNSNYDMEKFYYARWNLDLIEGPADMWFYSNQKNMSEFQNLYDFLSSEININNIEYKLFCRNSHGGIANGVRAWKWFLINHGLWRKRFPLNSEWE